MIQRREPATGLTVTGPAPGRLAGESPRAAPASLGQTADPGKLSRFGVFVCRLFCPTQPDTRLTDARSRSTIVVASPGRGGIAIGNDDNRRTGHRRDLGPVADRRWTNRDGGGVGGRFCAGHGSVCSPGDRGYPAGGRISLRRRFSITPVSITPVSNTPVSNTPATRRFVATDRDVAGEPTHRPRRNARVSVLQQPRDIFRSATFQLSRHWIVAAIVSTAVVAAATNSTIDGRPAWQWWAGISAATLVVAWLSMLPGMMLPAVGPTRDAATVAGLFAIGGVAAMAIRVGATVALVVACRYKFGPGNEEVGELPLASLMIGLWYVAATFDEVRMLAIGGRAIDDAHATENGS